MHVEFTAEHIELTGIANYLKMISVLSASSVVKNDFLQDPKVKLLEHRLYNGRFLFQGDIQWMNILYY